MTGEAWRTGRASSPVPGAPGVCLGIAAGGSPGSPHTDEFPAGRESKHVTARKPVRLFEPGVLPTAFALTGSRTTGAGVVISSYERTGAPTYGTYEPPESA